MAERNVHIAFVGTRADGEGGIYTFGLDPDTGELASRSTTGTPTNPSFLDLHPSGGFLYAVNQIEAGAVTAFSIDRATGGLARIDDHPTLDARPCHLRVDSSGRFVVVSHHTGGSLTVLAIGDDGGFDGITDRVTRTASSVHPERQTRSRPHAAILGPAGRYWYVPDLGADRVSIYELDRGDGTLHRSHPDVEIRAGSGPRHLAFHPNGRFCYLVNELRSTVTAFRRNPDTGALSRIQCVPALPDAFDGHSQAADVHVHPSGSWLYSSNRGHDSIASFAVDRTTGRLDPNGHVSTRGEWPRNFLVEPSGTFLYVENQHSDEIVTFRIDRTSGALAPTGEVTRVPRPVCMVLLPRP